MTKKLLLSVLMFLPLMASAKIYFDNTYVDGFYYKFNESDKTASVSCASYQNDNYYGDDPIDLPVDWYNIKSYYSGSIVIPSEVTYNEVPYKVTTIDYYAFYNCSGLTSITIPSSVTDICSNAFYGCSGLTSIVVEKGNPKYDSRNNCNAIIYSETNGLIKGCNNTIIPNNVTSIGGNAFQGCSGLTSINIPDGVTSIGGSAFSGCSGLTSVTIPNNVTAINNQTFSGCTGLASITIPAGITSIGFSAFDNCQNLTDVYCWAENAPSASSAFGNCNLGNITLHVPNSSYQEIQPWSSFGSIVPLPGYEFEIVDRDNTIINFAGYRVKEALVKICDLNKDGEISVWEAASLTNDQFKNLSLDKNIGSFDEFQYFTGVTEIPSSKFSELRSLKSIIIPNSVTSIKSSAFRECSSLSSITIPDNVTIIDSHTFENCTSLISVTIPNSVTQIGDCAFSGCNNLASVTIGIRVSRIKSGAFACSNLTDVYCLAEDVPSDSGWGFISSSVDYAPNITLHVPESSVEAYSKKEPWSNFKEIVPLKGEGQQIERCAKPTITYENGEFIFSCATEGAELHYEISTVNQSTGVATKLKVSPAFTISVYATKVGFYNSETATATFTGKFGDLNNDGEVNVADHVELSTIILGQ